MGKQQASFQNISE